MIMETAVKITELSKVYETSGTWGFKAKKEPVTAVDHVSLAVGKGELFGLLGPNGAGKTTLVKMLCTLILPTSGTASISGHDLSDELAIRATTGLVVSDERSFFWRLSVQRNLDFFAAMHGLHGERSRMRIQNVLNDVDLHNRAKSKFSDLSSGMRQRLAIARALLHEPKILFLDEPTRSLDPISTQRMHDLILDLMNKKEMTVFLITHDLSEAAKMCHRLALMDQARIRKVGRLEELRRELKPKRDYIVTCSPFNVTGDFLQLQEQIPSLQFGAPVIGESYSELRLQVAEDEGELSAVLDFLRLRNVQVHSIDGTLPTLEEVFAHYTAGQDE